MIGKLLDNILDLPAVDGACVFKLGGELILSKMPDCVTAEMCSDMVRRATVLFEAADEYFTQSDHFLLKYPEKLIAMHRHEGFVLFILANQNINVTSLRMATGIALKHITPELLEAQAARAAVTLSQADSRKKCVYRGVPFS